MAKMPGNATVLWTGGKDSTLAFYEARLAGYEITNLVTFVPRNPKFLAHPLGFMKIQAKAIGLQHHTLEVSEPYKESYVKAIHTLKEKYATDTLITGDIAMVDGRPNWIRECSKNTGCSVFTPLWGSDRNELLSKLLSYKFKAILSCVKKPWFTADWLGRELNKETLKQLVKMNKQKGLDISGEQGEYHTLTLDGPIYKKSIRINDYTKNTKGKIMYIDKIKTVLEEK